MNYSEMGRVFSYLLKYREAFSDPIGRKRREHEKGIVSLLLEAQKSGDIGNFENFLNAQGFSIRYYNGDDFGIQRTDGRVPVFFVLVRTDNDPPLYINKRWLIERFRRKRNDESDDKREESIDDAAIWAIQIWLLIQSFFYTQIGRTPHEVSRYNEAIISVRSLILSVKDIIAGLQAEGKKDGEAAIVMDILTKEDNKGIERKVKAFMKIMEEIGQVEDIGEEDEYRQTLRAAVEMESNAARGLNYLLPPIEGNMDYQHIINVIKGEE
jgi:hypothetical protein